MAAPNAVFFARNRCLTRLCDVYDAQTTIRNSAHHDIRRILVPLHAELRCSCLYFGFPRLLLSASALGTSNSDIARGSRHVSKVPIGNIPLTVKLS